VTSDHTERETGQQKSYAPDGIFALQANPLRDWLVAIGSLGKLELQAKRFVGRLRKRRDLIKIDHRGRK
jgi:hypothetical protein